MVPEDLAYCSMAHYLAKLYGIPPWEAFKMCQRDFITAAFFEQLELRKQNYLMEILGNEDH